MDEQAYRRRADEADSQMEHWRLQIEREESESRIRRQNIEADMTKENDASAQRIQNFERHLETAQQKEDQGEIDSWQRQIDDERQALESRLQKLNETLDREASDSARRIEEYHSEHEKSQRDLEENVRLAADEHEKEEKKRKEAIALEITRRLADNG